MSDIKERRQIREQTAKIIAKAQATLGSREALAAQLGVEPYKVAEWIMGMSDAPVATVNQAVDIVFAAMKPPA